MITVAVVDDDERVCHYVRRILENAPDLVVAWHALSGTEAVQTLRGSTVDVLLLDVRMPSLDGVSALEAILAEARAPAVVVLTNYNDERVVMRALRAGAAGVLLKSVSPSDLIAAVRMAASGHRVLGVGVTAPWERSPVDPGPPETPAEAALTARERDVLALLGDGLSNRAIAQRLALRQATVKGHVSALMDKLGCESRLQLGLFSQGRRSDR